MKATAQKQINLASYLDTLQAQGKYWLTKKETVSAIAVTDKAFNKAMNRLAKQNKIARVRNGFYVIVPPEYRTSKALPPTHYIDALMKFLKQPYYVGVLSASALHGSSHQSPQELQVVTSKPIPMIEIGNTRIRFLTKKGIAKTPTQQIKTPTGFMTVSTPAATIIDLLRYVRVAGHLDNVATAIIEMLENINTTDLIKVATQEKDLSYIQRLGYLIDRFSKNKTASRGLHKLIEERHPSFIFLRPDIRKGVIERNHKWNLFINTEVEPDL